MARQSAWRVAGAVLFYIVSSITMVLVNKVMLRNVHAPLTVLLAQLWIAAILLYILGASRVFRIPTLAEFAQDWRPLVPLIGINVVGLALNTLCLGYVSAAHYQVARSLVLPFTVLLSFLFLSVIPTPNILGACAIVVLGFWVGVAGELELSVIGVIFGVSSSITTALHAVVIKRSISAVGDNMTNLIFYNNILSAIALIPFAMLAWPLERDAVMAMLQDPVLSRQFAIQLGFTVRRQSLPRPHITST